METRLNRGLARVAGVLTSLVAALLLLFVAIALAGTALSLIRPLFGHGDLMRAVIEGLDDAFLVIILLELLHTTLSRGPVTHRVQEFLVVGITAGVRSGLELSAERGGDSRTIAGSLALDALGVLMLVGALWLVRQGVRAGREARSQSPPGGACGH
jgi:hypothetical protein